MTIAVIGCGYVGLATAVWASGVGHTVVAIEVDPDRFRVLQDGIVPFDEPDLQAAAQTCLRAGSLCFADRLAAVAGCAVVIVAVPTSEDAADRRLIDVVSSVWHHEPDAVLLIKSTIGPRHVAAIAELAHGRSWAVNPEFLREGSALHDVTHPDRIVLGGDPVAVTAGRAVYASHTAVPVVATDPMSAALGKLGANTMLAVRVAFACELAQLTAAVGGDYDGVLQVLASDPRIGPSHLRPSLGFGGPCLPKDARILADAGVPQRLAEAALKVNVETRAKVVAYLDRVLDGLQGRHIAVWGQSFKPMTGDTRESPALALTADLEARGAVVTVRPDEAATVSGADTDAIVVGTAWPAYHRVDPHSLVVARRFVVDLAGVLDARRWQAAGFEVWPGVSPRRG